MIKFNKWKMIKIFEKKKIIINEKIKGLLNNKTNEFIYILQFKSQLKKVCSSDTCLHR